MLEHPQAHTLGPFHRLALVSLATILVGMLASRVPRILARMGLG